MIDKAVEATKQVSNCYPNLKVDGELHLDVAIVEYDKMGTSFKDIYAAGGSVDNRHLMTNLPTSVGWNF
ncbi:MAG: hypothetical protein KKE16_07120 [Firmicutes bacterium]|nr:hypothetical protein [Bacillota bacterium]